MDSTLVTGVSFGAGETREITENDRPLYVFVVYKFTQYNCDVDFEILTVFDTEKAAQKYVDAYAIVNRGDYNIFIHQESLRHE
jgi:hypothetical protein